MKFYNEQSTNFSQNMKISCLSQVFNLMGWWRAWGGGGGGIDICCIGGLPSNCCGGGGSCSQTGGCAPVPIGCGAAPCITEAT